MWPLKNTHSRGKKSVLENWIIIWGRKLAVCPVVKTQILIHSFIIDQAPLYVRHWTRCWRYSSKKSQSLHSRSFLSSGRETHIHLVNPRHIRAGVSWILYASNSWTYRGQFAPWEAAKEKVQLCLYIKWMIYEWVFVCLFLFWGQGNKKNKCDLQVFVGFTYFNISICSEDNKNGIYFLGSILKALAGFSIYSWLWGLLIFVICLCKNWQ